MTQIVNAGTPGLTYAKHVQAKINCPNCHKQMTLDANSVDIGNVIQCVDCGHNTYYPFQKPWNRRGKEILIYLVSIVVSFMVGLFTNFAYDAWKDKKASTTQTLPSNSAQPATPSK